MRMNKNSGLHITQQLTAYIGVIISIQLVFN